MCQKFSQLKFLHQHNIVALMSHKTRQTNKAAAFQSNPLLFTHNKKKKQPKTDQKINCCDSKQ